MLIYWEQVTKGNGGHFADLLKPKISDSPNAFRFEIQEGFFCICKEKNLFYKKKVEEREGPEWKILRERGPRYSFYTAWSKQDLILQSCKIPFEPYNLGYILAGDLFFHIR